MRVTFELDQRQVLRLTEEMDRAARAAADLRPAWQEVSEIASEGFAQIFARQGAHGGPAWARLSPRTVRSRIRRRLTPIRVGWARGRMATSLIEPTSPFALEIRKPLEYVRGTTAANKAVSYPSVFEAGKPGQPARPIIGRLLGNQRIVTRIGDVIARHVLPDQPTR